jgi:sigma-54 dependent transcriptional regulator, acetoin dehydrogenase operon transcriptional activator AcoR
MSGNTKTMQPAGPRRAAPSGAGLVLLHADPIDSAPSVVPIAVHSFLIGREPPPGGGLALEQSSVSRLHAKLVAQDDGWRISDLESRNGTFVDGQRVGERAVLRDGAEIRIGDALFKFVLAGVDEYAPYRIDGTLARSAKRRSSAVPELVGGLQVDRIAVSIEAGARADLPVLVQGESGTGKEIVARAIHRLAGRSGAWCAINCAAVPANLFESELFGVKKGAFTGADRDKIGLIKAADGGTLFLDEVGDMPLEMQAKLLRVLEAREVRPVGSTQPEPVDVRVICATHWDLRMLVDQKRFRGDLFARLQGYDILLPRLSARKEDIYQLVHHFLARAGRSPPRLSFGFMLALCDYDWPYNVRELEVTVRRAVAVAGESELEVTHLPEALTVRAASYGSRVSTSPALEDEGDSAPAASAPSANELRAQLVRHGGNVAAVARELDCDPKQVHRWMRKHGISPGAYRG